MEGKKKTSGLSIAAFILGIVSLVCIILIWILGGIGKSATSAVLMGGCIASGVVGMATSVTGVVLAVMAKKREDTSLLGTLGLIFSTVGFTLCTMSLISCLSCTTCSAYSRRSVTSNILNSIF